MEKRKFRIKIDGKIFEAEIEEIGNAAERKPAAKSKGGLVQTPQAAPPPAQKTTGNAISAPMPGKIIAIKITQGQPVKPGEVVLIMEAMKMEQEIKSALEGTVVDIHVSEGETVKKDQLLISVN